MNDSEGAQTPPNAAPDEFATVEMTLAARDSYVGADIAGYHLVQLIAEGGMGEVWLAEQSAPVRRRVALKLVKQGMNTREVMARFESERQALALMNHPAIAKVFDAGSTKQGRPYFVMEYVPGIPINDYCDKHKLGVRERLALFRRVCDAVVHAHQKAIIHRDLKPSNILVTEVDGEAAPKIIDFGVAKAIAQKLTAATMFTRVGAILGTPEYMSPEQATSDGEDVDTRTDVYSLGVILYQLLAGAPPLDYRKLAFDEILRRLREDDAPPPSTKVRTLGDESATVARNRRTEPGRLTQALRGDLDAITLKALEKDRNRRYSSPSDMATDIGRYLNNEPVAARQASFAYRMRKYLRRHRVALSIGASLFALFVAFGVIQAMELTRIRRERDRADRVTQFMTEMFTAADPAARFRNDSHGKEALAREVLDSASASIESSLAHDPVLQAQMMQAMGRAYFNLDYLFLSPRALSLFQKAADIRRRLLGPDNPATLLSLEGEAQSLSSGAYVLSHTAAERRSRVLEAEKLEHDVVTRETRVLGPDHPQTLNSITTEAVLMRVAGKEGESTQLLERNLEAERRILGRYHLETLRTLHYLARASSGAEAEHAAREEYDARRRLLGPDHPDTQAALQDLADTLAGEERYAEASSLLEAEAERQRESFGPVHPLSKWLASDLADYLRDQQKYGDAESVLRRDIDTIQTEERQGALPRLLYELASVQTEMGKKNEALGSLKRALDLGYVSAAKEGLAADHNLAPLRGDSRFQALVEENQRNLQAARNGR